MEKQTQAQSQPMQPVPSPPVPSKQGIKSLTAITVLFFLLMTGGLVYLGYQNYQLQQKLNQLLKQQTNQTQAVTNSALPLISPTPNPTAKWKTYTSEVLNFSVKYPDSWYLTKCGPGEAALLNPSFSPQCAGEPYEPIQFFSSTEKQTEQEFLARMGPEFKLTPKAKVVEADITHQKYLLEKVQPAPGPDSYIQIRVPLNNGTFEIYVFDIQHEAIADQILSSFKSLN